MVLERLLIICTVVLVASAYQLCSMFLAFNITQIIHWIVLFFLSTTLFYGGAFSVKDSRVIPDTLEKSENKIFSNFLPWSILRHFNVVLFLVSMFKQVFLNALNVSDLFWRKSIYAYLEKSSTHISAYLFPPMLSISNCPNKSMWKTSKIWVIVMSATCVFLTLVSFPI